MKTNFGQQTFMYPMPVLIIATYNEDGTPNAMNAAWGGIHNTNEIGICIDSSHKTMANILQRKAFTVSFADSVHVASCDYVGIVSGNKEKDKVSKAGFSVTASENVDAPIINELPVCIECSLVSHDEKSDYVVGRIENVCAENDVLTDGKIDVTKINAITYDPSNHNYVELGKIAGKAFNIGKTIQ